MLKYLLPASSVLLASFAPTHSATTGFSANSSTTSQQLGDTPDVTDAATPDSARIVDETTDQPHDADDSSQRASSDGSDVAESSHRTARHLVGPNDDLVNLAQDSEPSDAPIFHPTAYLSGPVAGRMFTASTGDSARSSMADMADLPGFDPGGSWMVPEITLPRSTNSGATDPEPTDPGATDPWATNPSLLPPDVPNTGRTDEQEEIPDTRPPVQVPNDVIEVPEPASLGLVMLGIGGLAAARRRRAA